MFFGLFLHPLRTANKVVFGYFFMPLSPAFLFQNLVHFLSANIFKRHGEIRY